MYSLSFFFQHELYFFSLFVCQGLRFARGLVLDAPTLDIQGKKNKIVAKKKNGKEKLEGGKSSKGQIGEKGERKGLSPFFSLWFGREKGFWTFSNYFFSFWHKEKERIVAA